MPIDCPLSFHERVTNGVYILSGTPLNKHNIDQLTETACNEASVYAKCHVVSIFSHSAPSVQFFTSGGDFGVKFSRSKGIDMCEACVEFVDLFLCQHLGNTACVLIGWFDYMHS